MSIRPSKSIFARAIQDIKKDCALDDTRSECGSTTSSRSTFSCASTTSSQSTFSCASTTSSRSTYSCASTTSSRSTYSSSLFDKCAEALEHRRQTCEPYRCGRPYACKACKKLRSKLINNYHHYSEQVNDALKHKAAPVVVRDLATAELEARLVYECAFGMIQLQHIADGTWMNKGFRDDGHHTRVLKLMRVQKHGR
jgi:hypothetical protein